MDTNNGKTNIYGIIERQADASGIPKDEFLRFAYIETGGEFNPDAYNKSGAKGLFQFMPSTWREYVGKGVVSAGKEFDPVENTKAAAALYLDNVRYISRNGEPRSGLPFLSGESSPNGLDMYLAHQQGTGGYQSIQKAIATGDFSRADTRRNIISNISRQDFEQVTGIAADRLLGLTDRHLASSFVSYWGAKYARISIPELGIHPLTEAQAQADGSMRIGTRGETVRTLQEGLNSLGFRDTNGTGLEVDGHLGVRTQQVVVAFQRSNGVQPTGVVDEATQSKLAQQLSLPVSDRSQPPAQAVDDGTIGQRYWPAPGNYQLNRKDTPGEGDPNFGYTRRNADGSPRFHGGVDIEGKRGDQIVAFAGGIALVKPNNGAAGNSVQITHDDGTVTKYFHLDKIAVSNGRVQAGQQIGTLGDSGNAKGLTPHLHFEFWKDGKRVNPMHFIEALKPGGQQVVAPAEAQQQAVSGLLKMGSRGQQVAGLQAGLAALGYAGNSGRPLASDGHWGVETEYAIRSFQRAHGLLEDGIAGKNTLNVFEQAKQSPLISEATHPGHKLYVAIAEQLPSGTSVKVAANVTLQAMENGIDTPGKLGAVHVVNSDVYVLGAGNDPGLRSRTDMNAPTPDLQQMSEHMAREIAQQQQQQQQQQQANSVSR